MEREARLQAIACADPDDLVALADDVLETLDVEVTRGPTVGLLMVRVEEPTPSLTEPVITLRLTSTAPAVITAAVTTGR